MPLPGNDAGAWPPAEGANRRARRAEARTWYGGDPARLASRYGGGTTPTSHIGTSINADGRGVVQRAIGAISNRFWSTTVAPGETDTRRHLPIAQDIATLSSEWLFGEPPTFKVLGPLWPSDAEAVIDTATGRELEPAHRRGDPMPETVKAQERLDAILRASNAEALLLASAEISAALGSMPLRIAFDKAKMDMPRLVRVDPDATEPSYSWGALEGVTFWRKVNVSWAGTSATVVRHLELHEGGRIFHGLYQGGAEELGKRIPMSDGDAVCQAIAPQLDADSALRTKFLYEGKPVKTATSIPNVLPDPLDLDNLVGRSDFTPAVIDLMDAADRAYSQFIENLEDAKGRVLIARNMLESGGLGKGLTFDSSQRYFTKLNVPAPEKEGGGLPIEKVQFELRAQEYLSTIDALTSKAIEAAGWNPETDGTAAGGDMTATEVHDRRRRSNSTRDKKLRYIESELEALAFALLVIDRQEFNSGVTPFRVEVKFPEAVQPTVLELAQTAQALRAAKAASDRTLVELVHPDWDEPQVKAELDRMREDSRTIDPATIGLAAPIPGDAPAATTATTEGSPA